MQATLEISMYPLRSDFEDQVLQFISYLKSYPDMQLRVNSMSTQVVGPFDQVFKAVQSSIKKIYETDVKASFVVKVLPGKLDLDFSF